MTATPEEIAIINKLGDIYMEFLALPKEHDMLAGEFCEGIHRLQDQVAARATYRQMEKEK